MAQPTRSTVTATLATWKLRWRNIATMIATGGTKTVSRRLLFGEARWPSHDGVLSVSNHEVVHNFRSDASHGISALRICAEHVTPVSTNAFRPGIAHLSHIAFDCASIAPRFARHLARLLVGGGGRAQRSCGLHSMPVPLPADSAPWNVKSTYTQTVAAETLRRRVANASALAGLPSRPC